MNLLTARPSPSNICPLHGRNIIDPRCSVSLEEAHEELFHRYMSAVKKLRRSMNLSEPQKIITMRECILNCTLCKIDRMEKLMEEKGIDFDKIVAIHDFSSELSHQS